MTSRTSNHYQASARPAGGEVLPPQGTNKKGKSGRDDSNRVEVEEDSEEFEETIKDRRGRSDVRMTPQPAPTVAMDEPEEGVDIESEEEEGDSRWRRVRDEVVR